MTDTESRYANIERELLAVVFALERFHTYIYGKAVLLALLSLRATPIDNILPSPTELLFNRKVQGQIPHIIRHDSKSEGITRHLEQRQAVQKGYFDRQAHDLPPFLENQQVSVQDTGTGLWSPATIVKHSGEPRSYIIETPDGTTLQRNRLHLKDSTRARPADHPPQPDDDDAGDNAATEGESVRQHPSCAPDDPATRFPSLPPGSSNPPGKMTDCASKPTTGLHTRSGRAVKPPRRLLLVMNDSSVYVLNDCRANCPTKCIRLHQTLEE
ncbi:hypothetical protein ElyMa_001796400 [Elysia marginata]|uniref:Reverse transcriptase RNase H-like domain-containing protein n=1 Tax=Elysia marginata TaxID=1093978 RepID=A0AAV4EG75_9GAST|nr:hypothetical protein ElyMa_001796400 [Elysia marginata]